MKKISVIAQIRSFICCDCISGGCSGDGRWLLWDYGCLSFAMVSCALVFVVVIRVVLGVIMVSQVVGRVLLAICYGVSGSC